MIVIWTPKMQWPSKNVCQGGILQPAKTTYSPETHKFLKVLMDESKFSMSLRNKVDYVLRTGDSLPSPSSNRSNNSKTGQCGRSLSPPMIRRIRPGSSKRRSVDTIIRSGAYEREKFVPKHPRCDRDREKQRLQNKMAFGTDIEPKLKRIMRKSMTESREGPEENRFDQLVTEIKEREEWLDDMEKLGADKEYKLIIQQQIEDRVREMERLKLDDK